MHRMFVLFGLVLAVSAAHADILPEPDHGPPMATVAGLDFMIQSVEVKFPPGYTKTAQTVILTGCTHGHVNCRLARSKSLIGMEVVSVDNSSLRPEHGMIQQIADAFARKKGTQKVTLELYARGSEGSPVKVAFASR